MSVYPIIDHFTCVFKHFGMFKYIMLKYITCWHVQIHYIIIWNVQLHYILACSNTLPTCWHVQIHCRHTGMFKYIAYMLACSNTLHNYLECSITLHVGMFKYIADILACSNTLPTYWHFQFMFASSRCIIENRNHTSLSHLSRESRMYKCNNIQLNQPT